MRFRRRGDRGIRRKVARGFRACAAVQLAVPLAAQLAVQVAMQAAVEQARIGSRVAEEGCELLQIRRVRHEQIPRVQLGNCWKENRKRSQILELEIGFRWGSTKSSKLMRLPTRRLQNLQPASEESELRSIKICQQISLMRNALRDVQS